MVVWILFGEHGGMEYVGGDRSISIFHCPPSVSAAMCKGQVQRCVFGEGVWDREAAPRVEILLEDIIMCAGMCER